MNKQIITVQTVVNAPLVKVWQYWNEPKHIMAWAFASDDWEAPLAENDLREGGRFKTVMSAKDKSSSFDFTGTYTKVRENELIEYDMDRGTDETESRQVKVEFKQLGEGVKIILVFDAENVNPLEVQSSGWQTMLDNFKKYAEQN